MVNQNKQYAEVDKPSTGGSDEFSSNVMHEVDALRHAREGNASKKDNSEKIKSGFLDMGDRTSLYGTSHGAHQESETTVKHAIDQGLAATKTNQYGNFFLSIHELQAANHGNPNQLHKDMAQINESLQSKGMSVVIDKSYSDQIHLYKTTAGTTQLALTSTYLHAGHGRDAQVITDSNNAVISGGITYYKEGERAVSHGSTTHHPTEAMFEETDITTSSGLQAAMQRLDVMHSMGIRKVVLAVDEAICNT